MHAEIGRELGFLEWYFTYINKHFYNTDENRLPLAIDEDYVLSGKDLANNNALFRGV